MALVIRKVQTKDWNAIKEIYNEWRTANTYAVPTDIFSDKLAKQKVKDLKKGINLIAEVDKKVVGLIESKQGYLPKTKHTLNIGQLNVLKAYRKQGVAKALIKQIFKIAKQKKIKIAFLYVASINKPAISLYKELGFIKTGYIKNQLKFKNKYVNNNIMSKTL